MAGFERLEYLFEQNLTTDIQEYLPILSFDNSENVLNLSIKSEDNRPIVDTDKNALTNNLEPLVPKASEIFCRNNNLESITIESSIFSQSYSDLEFVNGFDLDSIKSSIGEIKLSNEKTQGSCDEFNQSPVIELEEKKNFFNKSVRTLSLNNNKYSNLRDLFDTDSFEVVLNSDDDSVNYLNTNDEELLEKIHKDFADYKKPFLDSWFYELESGSFLDIFNICLQVVDLLLDQIERSSLSLAKHVVSSKVYPEECILEALINDKKKIKNHYLEIPKSKKRFEQIPPDEMKVIFYQNLSIRLNPNKVRKIENFNKPKNLTTLSWKESVIKLPFISKERHEIILKKIEFIFLINLEIAFNNIALSIDTFNYKISDLSIDVCNHLLKHHMNDFHEDKERARWFRMLIVCAVCVDSMFNNSIHFMLTYLSSQGSDILIEDDVTEILHQVDKLITNESQSGVMSKIKNPKIENICTYLKRISGAASKLKKIKVLIIISRHVEHISIRLNEEILKETSFNSKIYNPSFENEHNDTECLIIPDGLNIYESFKSFTHVITYEHQIIKEPLNCSLKIFCAQNNIVYTEFDVYKLEDSIKENLVKSRDTYDWFMIRNRELLVSSLVTRNTRFVEVLETKLNFTLFERNYEIDILIDHLTGCLILDQERLETINFENFAKILKSLDYKLQYLYIICLLNDRGTKDNFQKYLQLSKITNHVKKSVKLMIKIVHLNDDECFEAFIRRLFLNSMKNLCPDSSKYTPFFILDDAVQYRENFFSILPEVDELLIMSLGCLNSYQSQYILSRFNFITIAKMNSSDLKKSLDQKIVSDASLRLIFNILEKA